MKWHTQCFREREQHVDCSGELRCFDAVYSHLRHICIIGQLLLAQSALFTQVPKTSTECFNTSRIFHGWQAPTGLQ